MIKNRNKYGAIIEARMGSSRLPGKVLMKFNKVPAIRYLVERLKYVTELDDIIVATTINKKDDQLVKYLSKFNIKYFRGSEENVLQRVLIAAKKYDIKNIVQVTGDCPLIDPTLVSQTINVFKNNKNKYVSNSTIRSYPDGMDVAVFSTKDLQKVSKLTKNKEDLEHVTLYFKNNPNKFSQINLMAPSKHHMPELGLTLDEINDYKLINTIISRLHSKKKAFSLDDILTFLMTNKKYLKINENVKRKVVKVK